MLSKSGKPKQSNDIKRDASEVEADRFSDRITSMSAHDSSPFKSSRQSHSADTSTIPYDIRIRAENNLGLDFSNVKIHRDVNAANRSLAHKATAFTRGQDIYFGKNQYDPYSIKGKRLIAHELTHVAQQSPERTLVQQKVPTGSNQQSPLSNELQEILIQEGEEAFFERLQELQVSDQDVFDLVEQTFTGDDLFRARAIMGQVVLEDTTRNALVSQLVHRLASAQDDFDRAIAMVEQDLRAEAQAKAELVKLFVSMATAFIVPGLGGAITRLANQLPATASVGMHRAALAIQNQAPNIASAIGEWGKHAAGQAVNQALAQNPRDFFNALREGFQASNSEILSDIRSKISDREELPDHELILYVANWDTREITATRYANLLREQWNRYATQVLSVGETDFSVINAFAEITSSSIRRLVRVRGRSQSTLALVDYRTRASMGSVESEKRWVTTVSSDLVEMAIQRARQRGQSDIPTLEASEVSGVPSRYR